MAKFCKKCGTEIPGGRRSCPNCPGKAKAVKYDSKMHKKQRENLL